MEAIKTRRLFGREETARRLLTRLAGGKIECGHGRQLHRPQSIVSVTKAWLAAKSYIHDVHLIIRSLSFGKCRVSTQSRFGKEAASCVRATILISPEPLQAPEYHEDLESCRRAAPVDSDVRFPRSLPLRR